MRTLLASLSDHPIAMLRGIAAVRGIELATNVRDDAAAQLAAILADPASRVVTLSGSAAGSVRFVFEAPPELARFVASKGSIAVDGISLTVNSVEDQPDGSVHFGLNIIPHTASVTRFGILKPGDPVNIEIDMLARYVARLAETK